MYGINGVESILNSNKCQVSQIIVSEVYKHDKMADSSLITNKFKNNNIQTIKNQIQENARKKNMLDSSKHSLEHLKDILKSS